MEAEPLLRRDEGRADGEEPIAELRAAAVLLETGLDERGVARPRLVGYRRRRDARLLERIDAPSGRRAGDELAVVIRGDRVRLVVDLHVELVPDVRRNGDAEAPVRAGPCATALSIAEVLEQDGAPGVE